MLRMTDELTQLPCHYCRLEHQCQHTQYVWLKRHHAHGQDRTGYAPKRTFVGWMLHLFGLVA